MTNHLVCLEGTLHFDEDVKTQTINIISFRTGQQITINRSRLNAGCTLAEDLSHQINNAEKIYNQFNLVKMEEIKDGDCFTKTVEIIYNFLPAPGASNRIWQVSYACQISEVDILNFISVYPDETSMKNEMGRLHYCAKNFILAKS